MAAPATPVAADADIACRALELALVATQLRAAWHANVIDSDTAMRSLDLAVREVCSLRAMERTEP